MKKAIGDNMIPKEWGFAKGLELVKQAGFDGIELWLGDVPWFQPSTADGDVRELRRKIADAGLVVSNVSTGLHWASPLSARDPTVRARAMRIVERQIETAVLLGTDAILVVAGLVTEEVPYNEVYQRCVDALGALGETAARAGVPVGCEMGITRRGFLGCVAGSLTAGLPFDGPRRIDAGPPRVLLDLREHCGLRESVAGYESALAGLGTGVTFRCTLLIVPAALDIPPPAVRAIMSRLRTGATVLLESGAGFAADRDFRAHRAVLRDQLGVHIQAPVRLWSRRGARG